MLKKTITNKTIDETKNKILSWEKPWSYNLNDEVTAKVPITLNIAPAAIPKINISFSRRVGPDEENPIFSTLAII